ncbi:hypothetical protein LINGRAHAP2_LOCUS6297 [Linum grandiflorum]
MKIAEEGFSLIDNGYHGGGGGGYSSAAVHRRSSSTAHHYAAQYQTYQYQTEQNPCIYYCPRMSKTTVRLPAATEGIRYYQSSRVPAARKEERVMTSDEAAQMFSGFVVVDHGPTRRSSQWGF